MKYNNNKYNNKYNTSFVRESRLRIFYNSGANIEKNLNLLQNFFFLSSSFYPLQKRFFSSYIEWKIVPMHSNFSTDEFLLLNEIGGFFFVTFSGSNYCSDNILFESEQLEKLSFYFDYDLKIYDPYTKVTPDLLKKFSYRFESILIEMLDSTEIKDNFSQTILYKVKNDYNRNYEFKYFILCVSNALLNFHIFGTNSTENFVDFDDDFYDDFFQNTSAYKFPIRNEWINPKWFK